MLIIEPDQVQQRAIVVAFKHRSGEEEKHLCKQLSILNDVLK